MGVEAQRRRQLEQLVTQGHVPLIKARGLQTLQTYCTPALVNNGGPMAQETTVIQDHPTNTLISTKDWSLDFLLEQSPTFRPVRRIKAQDPGLQKHIDNYEADKDAQPLIIEGWQHHESWPGETFNIDWFGRHGPNTLSVRNMHTRLDKDIPLSQFIETSRVSPVHVEPHETERLYGKDVECPKKWAEWLNSGGVLPQCLVPHGSNDLMLNSSLSTGVETLMCYLGIGDTFTPCHKDLCASSGQNLMCYTERGGSSFWFMTGGSSSFKVAEFFHTLGQEVDHENYVIDIATLTKAPFPVYIAEQKLGDLVLVPPRSCHQVVNNGGLTLKTSWSRMTLRGLEVAYHFELPLYRRVCRPEVYRIKETVQHALRTFTNELLFVQSNSTLALRAPSQVAHDLSTALRLFDAILVEEAAPQKMNIPVLIESNGEEDDRFTCDFCSGDIFQSFFGCRDCVAGNRTADLGGGFIVCPGCYIEGRSCRCEIMEPVQRHSFGSFVALRKEAVSALQNFQQGSEPAHSSIESMLKRGDGAFRAACRLQSHRKEQNRTCVPVRSSQSHSVSSAAALYCKNCRHSRCFFHLLTHQKLHAHDALVSSTSDYHNLHMNSHNAYLAGSDRRLLSHRHGTPPQEPNIMRSYFSLNFRKCKPANYQYTKAGWYDIVVKEAPPVINESPNTCGSSSFLLFDDCPIHTSSPLSSVPDSDDGCEVEEQPQVTAVSVLSPISRSQPFVLVPPAPYNIRMARIVKAPTPPPLQESPPIDDQLGHMILPDNAPTIFPISSAPSIMSEAQPPVQQSLRFRKGSAPHRSQPLADAFNVAASGHTPSKDPESPVYSHDQVSSHNEGSSSTQRIENTNTETNSLMPTSEDRERIERLEAMATSWSQEKETLHWQIAALQSRLPAATAVQPQQIVTTPLDPHWMEKAKILFECIAHVPLLPDILPVSMKPQYRHQQRDLERQWGMNHQRSQVINGPQQHPNLRPDRYQPRRPQLHVRQPHFGNYDVNHHEYQHTTGGRPDRVRQTKPYFGPYSPKLRRPSTSSYNLMPNKKSPDRRNNGSRRRSRFDDQWQRNPKTNNFPTLDIQVEAPRPVVNLNVHSNVTRLDPPEQERSTEVQSEENRANQQQAAPDVNSADDGHELDTVCASSPDVYMRPHPRPIETSDQDWEDNYEQLDNEQASPQPNALRAPAEANVTSTVGQTGAGNEDNRMLGMTEHESHPCFEDNPWA